jgi:hypothetical protein
MVPNTQSRIVESDHPHHNGLHYPFVIGLQSRGRAVLWAPRPPRPTVLAPLFHLVGELLGPTPSPPAPRRGPRSAAARRGPAPLAAAPRPPRCGLPAPRPELGALLGLGGVLGAEVEAFGSVGGPRGGPRGGGHVRWSGWPLGGRSTAGAARRGG